MEMPRCQGMDVETHLSAHLGIINTDSRKAAFHRLLIKKNVRKKSVRHNYKQRKSVSIQKLEKDGDSMIIDRDVYGFFFSMYADLKEKNT